MVIEDLGAWAAGTRVAHGPEVVFLAESLDTGLLDASHLVPERCSLVVILEHGDPELVLVDPEFFREEGPRQTNRFTLEVVAKAEVSEHLEEGVVARSPPHVLEVVVLT